MGSSRNRKRNYAAIGLFSVASIITSASSSGIPQHRVQRAQRTVPYRHVLEDRNRPEHLKFRIPSGTDPYVEEFGEQDCRRESGTESEGCVFRVLDRRGQTHHVSNAVWTDSPLQQSSHSYPDERYTQPRDERIEETIRSLTDQKTTEEESTVEEDTEFWNITASIDLESTKPSNQTSSEIITSSHYSSNTTGDGFEPIRIRAVLSEQLGGGQFLTSSELAYLFEDLLRPALLAWSAALRVDPVVGNLTVDVDQLYDGQSCGPGLDSGLPSAPVPIDHLKEGIPDTDMVVYLNLGFVEGTGSARNEELEARQMPPPQIRRRVEENRELKAALNITGNDTLTGSFPDANKEYIPICTGDYLAAATYCSTDQYDRPTAGLLHICIDDDFFLESNLQRNILSLMHELAHALGFNSQSMAHFRHPDGTPITPRVNGDVPDTEVECTGPGATRRFANVTLPSQEILQFKTVRGGVRVAEVVTPSVQQIVRNHFDCQTLSGAELESGEFLPLASGGGTTSCLGDHWERRLFRSDLMNPIIDGVPFSSRISTITLAYFADSGWYQVDLSRAAETVWWGRGAGCSFVDDPCIGEDGQVSQKNQPFFCNDVPKYSSNGVAEEIQGCTPDLTRKAVCSMGQYSSELPPEYRYFGQTYGTNVGGDDPFADFCPVYTGFSNGLCMKPESEQLRLDEVEQFGQRNSRCLSGRTLGHAAALCLPIACVVEDRTLRIQIGDEWRLCEYSGQELRVDEDSADSTVVVCPEARRICTTFYCRRDCLGTGGQCDFATGRCLCRPGGENARSSVPDDTLLDECLSDVDDGKDPWLPDDDSPLSDYYFSSDDLFGDQANAKKRPLLVLYAAAAMAFVILVATAITLVCMKKPSQATTEDNNETEKRRCLGRLFRCGEAKGCFGWTGLPRLAWLSREQSSGSSSPFSNSRNKEKMIATVLVDMRIHAPDLQDGILNVSSDSISDTDGSLTLTDASANLSFAEESVRVLDIVAERIQPRPAIRRRPVADRNH